MKAYYQIIVSDKNGKVVKRYKQKVCKSYLLQWLKILNSIFKRGYAIGRYSVTQIRDVNNTLLDFIAQTCDNNTIAGLNALEADATYGIVVGLGSEAVENTDYKLQTKIAHGTGLDQLLYSGHSWVDAAIVGDNVDFKIVRNFSNLSGNTVIVTEIGIYCKVYGSAANQYFCLLRDLPTLVELENEKTITVIYTLRTTA